jgi:hypothetical protein
MPDPFDYTMKENKPRKQIKNEINKSGSRGTADNDDRTEVEDRKTTYTTEPNKFEQLVDARKKIKRDRDEDKIKNSYSGKGQVENRGKAEAEQDFLNSPTEKEMNEELQEEASEPKE